MNDNHLPPNQPYKPLERKTIWKEGEPLPKGEGYAPASETDLTKAVLLRGWISRMLNSMTLVELATVEASVDSVLNIRKPIA